MSEGPKTVLVTGDVMMEWRFAESRVRDRADSDALFDPFNYMERFAKPVGAVSVGAILTRTLAGFPSMSAGMPRPRVQAPERKSFMNLPRDNPYWNSYAVCARFPKERDSKEREFVWRVKQKLGLDRKGTEAIPAEQFGDADDGCASLVIFEQSQQGFMPHRKAWPRSLSEPRRDDAWLLVEWSRPRFDERSDFWSHIAKPEHFRDRIVIIVTAEDLRLAGMRVSRGLSWERTASELYEDLLKLWKRDRERFSACAYLVVSFGTSGAVLFWAEGEKL